MLSRRSCPQLLLDRGVNSSEHVGRVKTIQIRAESERVLDGRFPALSKWVAPPEEPRSIPSKAKQRGDDSGDGTVDVSPSALGGQPGNPCIHPGPGPVEATDGGVFLLKEAKPFHEQIHNGHDSWVLRSEPQGENGREAPTLLLLPNGPSSRLPELVKPAGVSTEKLGFVHGLRDGSCFKKGHADVKLKGLERGDLTSTPHALAPSLKSPWPASVDILTSVDSKVGGTGGYLNFDTGLAEL